MHAHTHTDYVLSAHTKSVCIYVCVWLFLFFWKASLLIIFNALCLSRPPHFAWMINPFIIYHNLCIHPMPLYICNRNVAWPYGKNGYFITFWIRNCNSERRAGKQERERETTKWFVKVKQAIVSFHVYVLVSVCLPLPLFVCVCMCVWWEKRNSAQTYFHNMRLRHC